MHIDFDGLECRSAFDIAGAECIRPTSLGFGDQQGIRLVMLRDILYLPSVLEYGQSILPGGAEAHPMRVRSLDCSSVQFLRESRQRTRNDQRHYSDPFEVITSEEVVCILGNMFSRNFGHWSEELLKVALLERMPRVPVRLRQYARVRARLFTSSWYRGEADHFGGRSDPVLSMYFHNRSTSREPDRPSRRLILTSRSRSLETRHRVRGLAPGDCGQREDKCFAMVGLRHNKEDVYRCLADYSFEVVDLAALPVVEQLRMVSNATVLAGPHGAQFVHAQFMPTSSTVIECFSPVHVNPSILQICRVLNHSYHQVVARSHVTAPYPYR